jgi:hypothetical protein
LALVFPITFFIILFHENRKLPVQFYRILPIRLWFKHSFHYTYGVVFGTVSGMISFQFFLLVFWF